MEIYSQNFSKNLGIMDLESDYQSHQLPVTLPCGLWALEELLTRAALKTKY